MWVLLTRLYGKRTEKMLQREMDAHLCYGPNDRDVKNTQNHCNGYGSKTIKPRNQRSIDTRRLCFISGDRHGESG